MSGWEVGDLAVADSGLPYCACCEADDELFDGPNDATVEIVVAVGKWPGEVEVALTFASDADDSLPWCACQFRKIAPDKAEACETEFVTLLKRSKVTA